MFLTCDVPGADFLLSCLATSESGHSQTGRQQGQQALDKGIMFRVLHAACTAACSMQTLNRRPRQQRLGGGTVPQPHCRRWRGMQGRLLRKGEVAQQAWVGPWGLAFWGGRIVQLRWMSCICMHVC